jgi:hypothetical protein
MRLSKTLFTGILVASCVSPALAQTKVGELLDSGAVKLSAADFKQQIVGRFLVDRGAESADVFCSRGRVSEDGRFAVRDPLRHSVE